MKKFLHTKVREEIRRSSKFSGDSFAGNDTKSPYEIIEADKAIVLKHDLTLLQIAMRMQNITDIAAKNPGTWVRVDDKTLTQATEIKGVLHCPFPHNESVNKRVTVVRHIDLSQIIQWSDLNIHLIAIHGFFGDKDSIFRLEPRQLIKLLFQHYWNL